jgi:hypothetical protein
MIVTRTRRQVSAALERCREEIVSSTVAEAARHPDAMLVTEETLRAYALAAVGRRYALAEPRRKRVPRPRG